MPKLRIHFTDRDIARTRLKLEPDVMREIVGSAQVLRHREGDLAFDPWRRRVRELAARDADLRTALRTVLSTRPQRLHAEAEALRVYFRSVIEPHLPAKLVGVAPATVSHHTAVLREAGLITTERDENFARHLITPLGLRVLAAGR
ncbi:helix-turn-helix domain-containing protein [Lentzea sp. NPDC004782]|uniref:helix-turn-helix domain-containing protein n=1 Tax=Lentzea sp. NPDC004782 TaxID=3154458 RepID=UPI0033BD765A